VPPSDVLPSVVGSCVPVSVVGSSVGAGVGSVVVVGAVGSVVVVGAVGSVVGAASVVGAVVVVVAVGSVVVGAVVVAVGSCSAVVTAGVAEDKSTFTSVYDVCSGLRTAWVHDWSPPDSTEAHTCAFWMLRSIGTMSVIGTLTVVSSIPIIGSCALAYCTVKADVIVSTNGLIMMFVNTAATPSLLVGGWYDCGAAKADCERVLYVVRIAVVSNVAVIVAAKTIFDTLFEVIIMRRDTLFYLRRIR
jgi:hypothetical protein